jgi:hypothetical protein
MVVTVNIFIGLKTKDGRDVSPEKRKEAEDMIGTQLSIFYGGCTITETTGFYKGTREPSIVLQSFADHFTQEEMDAIKRRTGMVAVLLEQESVLVAVTRTDGHVHWATPLPTLAQLETALL